MPTAGNGRGYTPRLVLLLLVGLLLNGLLAWRLYALQVQGGAERRERTENQSIRRIRLPAVRGRIYSSDGQVLAGNQVVYDVYLHPHELRQNRPSATCRRIQQQAYRVAKILRRPNPVTPERIQRHLKLYPTLPLKVAGDLRPDELARLEELMPGLAGVEVGPDWRRVYPLGSSAAHLLGYLGRHFPNAEEAGDAYCFYPERRGKQGLEGEFDDELAGTPGLRLVRVDSIGYCREELSVEEPVPGHEVLLTLDSRAQTLAERLLGETRGALVCVDVNSGAVLALASSPSFDLNRLAALYPELATDETNRPLLNRALAGEYSPGSIVKPLVSLALLEDGRITAATTADCPGYYLLGRRRIHCHDRHGHGAVNVLEALEVSCNPFFIGGGLGLGIERLTPMFAAAGFGAPTGFEVPGRFADGRLPAPASLQAEAHRRWAKFDTAMVSIGQGYCSMSPLQAAIYTAALANGGTLYRPFIVRAVATAEGLPVRETAPLARGRLPASPEHLALVREGMRHVLYGPHATAASAQSRLISLAGKTGTAEVATRTGRINNTWFICFGPYEAPRYAVAVLVEEGASGGRTAAPIARGFFDGYLPLLESQATAAVSEPPTP